MTQPGEFWNSAYDNDTAPWLIGEPQPAIVELVEHGLVRGTVLDVGCGAGEHTIHLAKLGYDVLGVDLSPSAVDYARANAERHAVAARFAVGDATRLDDLGPFDTIVDSALFHVFAHDNGDATGYVRSLRAACKPDTLVHILALSTAGPGFGPRIPADAIRDAFPAPWTLEALEPSRYRARIPADYPDAAALGAGPSGTADLPAWLARLRPE